MTITAKPRSRPRAGGPPVTELPGMHFPLGATVQDGGTNFAVAAADADAMLLCLFGDGGLR